MLDFYISQFTHVASYNIKIDTLVYENRQHCLGMIYKPDSAPPAVTDNGTSSNTSTEEKKEGRTTPSRARSRMKKPKRKVTFVQGADLVSIRYIPPRSGTPISSIEGSASSGSSSEEESDSESSDGDTSDEDDDIDDDLLSRVSRLACRSSETKPLKSSLKKTNTMQSVNNPSKAASTKSKTRSSTNYNIRSSLAKRRLVMPKSTAVLETHTHNHMRNSNGSRKAQTDTIVAPSAKRFGTVYRPISRPLSCPTNQQRTQPTNPLVVRENTTPKLRLSFRSRFGEDSSVLEPMTAKTTSVNNGIGPQNERYSWMTSSGQERTKLYAWQVANGAPLVTTPSIAPMYSEQVSVTKLDL